MFTLNIPEKATGKVLVETQPLMRLFKVDEGYLLTGLFGQICFSYYYNFYFWESTSGLYADWLARRQQSRSLLVDEEQNEMCAFLA